MTEAEALKLLRGGEEGVAEWNSRRRAGEEVPSLVDADLDDADLRGADLDDADLRGADLGGAYLAGAGLRRADLREADLRMANLSGARLRGAYLHGAYLYYADLSGADLREACLPDANLVGANLSGADLSEAEFGGTIVACDLSQAIGLDEVIHRWPSVVDVAALRHFTEELPETFLRGCGLSDQDIEYFRAVVGRPIRFYSCFISYCTDDEAFATRLHNDFQEAGIRCWKWDHDARTGEELFGEINQAIRIHDKVVLIASEHSLTSAPVNREIERAIQEEDRRAKLKAEGKWKGVPSVLFPVRLDNYVFEETADCTPMWDHPRRADVLKKMIADGEGWETDNKKYETVRDRLIRDMKTGAT